VSTNLHATRTPVALDIKRSNPVRAVLAHGRAQ